MTIKSKKDKVWTDNQIFFQLIQAGLYQKEFNFNAAASQNQTVMSAATVTSQSTNGASETSQSMNAASLSLDPQMSDSLLEEFTSQAILGIPAVYLETHPILVGNIQSKWMKQLLQQQKHYMRVLYTEGILNGLLSSIPYVILKGTAASIYYPEPALRTYGDIDLLVMPEDFERTASILKENDFIYQGDDTRHAVFSWEKIQVELHHGFEEYSANPERKLDQMLFAAIPHAVERSVDGCAFSMLPDSENGLVLLYHLKEHLRSGLGLRQVIDWMMYVENVLSDSFWQSGFQSKAQELGLEQLAVITTRMCQIYLGLNPDITWCRSVNEQNCSTLMEYILKRGNFGSKDGNHTVQVMYVLTSGHFFRRLQKRGEYNWKTAQKYPVLRQFAWIYQIGRYIHMGLRRKNPFRSLLKDFRESRARRKLFRTLKM